jgi:hypothetical protein
MREKKESKREEPVRRMATSRKQTTQVRKRKMTFSGEGSRERPAIWISEHTYGL